MIPFHKYECGGNDFVLVQPGELSIPEICHRQKGVGADGVLFLEMEGRKVQYFNSDGSGPYFCGNGLLCAAHFLGEESGSVEMAGKKWSYTREGDWIWAQFPEPLALGENRVQVGVPHLYSFCENVDRGSFPEEEGNVSLVQRISESVLRLRTRERGVGETLSCGSAIRGAIALCGDQVRAVQTRGGEYRFDPEKGLAGKPRCVFYGGYGSYS